MIGVHKSYLDRMKQQEIDKYGREVGSKLPYSGSKNQIMAGMTGEAVAGKLFGTDSDKIGDINKNVIAEREAALNQTDPVSTRIKQSSASQVRAARAAAQGAGRNLSAGEQAQINRSAERDVADALYTNRQNALDKYAKTGGSLASNVLSTIMGYQGIEKAGTQITAPDSGTVICTELHRQGYLTDEEMDKDTLFGIQLRYDNPEIYIGYIMWAPYIVKLMKKSKLFTKLVSFIGVPWAKNMAHGNNKFGNFINKVGMPVCGALGRLKLWKRSTNQSR